MMPFLNASLLVAMLISVAIRLRSAFSFSNLPRLTGFSAKVPSNGPIVRASTTSSISTCSMALNGIESKAVDFGNCTIDMPPIRYGPQS